MPTVDGLGQVNYRTMMEDLIHDFGRDDWENYKPLLLQFLRLFGAGIHESLTRTCHDQLPHVLGRRGGGLDAGGSSPTFSPITTSRRRRSPRYPSPIG